jgi:hypothetical protein
MFEKEAEYYAFDEVNHKQEWYIKHPEYSIDCDYEDIKKHWGKGAEFGYKKANEWHKVADEGLPINKNDGTTYLLYTIYGEGGSPVVAHFAYRDKQELMNVWTGAILTEDKIIAWKEIVLPKEIE